MRACWTAAGNRLSQQAGLQVDSAGLDRAKVDLVNSGTMPFMERGADELLRSVAGKSLRATLDPDVYQGADAVITVVGTPVDRHLNPTVGDVYRSIDALLDHMQDGTSAGAAQHRLSRRHQAGPRAPAAG